jgi:hypothetical protein
MLKDSTLESLTPNVNALPISEISPRHTQAKQKSYPAWRHLIENTICNWKNIFLFEMSPPIAKGTLCRIRNPTHKL